MALKKMVSHEKKEQEVEIKGQVNFSDAWQARVEEVVGRTGTRGDVTQVRVKIL